LLQVKAASASILLCYSGRRDAGGYAWRGFCACPPPWPPGL